jgi:hypothetical protein
MPNSFSVHMYPMQTSRSPSNMARRLSSRLPGIRRWYGRSQAENSLWSISRSTSRSTWVVKVNRAASGGTAGKSSSASVRIVNSSITSFQAMSRV